MEGQKNKHQEEMESQINKYNSDISSQKNKHQEEMENSINLLTTQKNMMQSDFEESERMLK
jgi:hypothetical protein